MNMLRQSISNYELLFTRLPETYGSADGSFENVVQKAAEIKQLFDRLLSELKLTLIAQTKQEFQRPDDKQTMEQMSLASAITDWCDSLNPRVFEQLFSDGTDRCLKLFKTISNDEDTFICTLAKLATGLRVEDWNDQTARTFADRIHLYHSTAEAFVSDNVPDTVENTSSYQISFVNEDGVTVTKRFDHVEYSRRGKLLYNQINQNIEAMGRAISEQEKRQILMEILKNMC